MEFDSEAVTSYLFVQIVDTIYMSAKSIVSSATKIILPLKNIPPKMDQKPVRRTIAPSSHLLLGNYRR